MDETDREVKELEGVFTSESAEPIQISYSVIKYITKNFCQVIGSGGFGVVYLGSLRNDLMVAVKELRISQDVSDTQFLMEIKCLKKVKHKNIVRFLGYCAYTDGVVMKVENEDRLVDVPKRFLCFEYAPNGNLGYYLQENTYKHEWSVKYKMIRGICHGLHYLHQQRVAHLDLKPDNVLLGDQMEPKITDFGLSRCNDGTQSIIFTKNLQGTPGYIPPEFIDEGKISFKTDIYSLGIIMIRLLTGSNKDIPKNWYESLSVDCQQMKTCIEIAQICIDEESKRPKISCIISMLTETETVMENIRPIIIPEPRNDQTSELYKNVQRFLAWRSETGEHNRLAEKLPVERPKWKLEFQSPPKLPIITGRKIVDANGKPLEVILVDAETGDAMALQTALAIELVPLLGNFPQECWDADDFRRGIVKDPEGKHPLLGGEHRLTMWDGHATVYELMFMNNSLKCGCMFRIGVRIVPGSYRGAKILEGMTEAFMVRNPLGYEIQFHKHYKWQLEFQSQPRLPICVGHSITDVIGNPLEVILVNTETGAPSALPMELPIELVLLWDDIAEHDNLYWWSNKFDKHIEENLRPPFSRDVSLTMKDDGRITLNELQFMDNSCCYARTLFRIGVRVPGGYNAPSPRIHEGITKAFDVNENQVWTLKSIPWGGLLHKRLVQNSVKNVQDFVSMLVVKPEVLRAIMGDDMMDEDTWEEITQHAILPGDKVYSYRAMHATIYVTSIFHLVKVEFGGVECPLQLLDNAQKRLVQQAMREAYEHRHSLQNVDLKWKLVFKSPPRLPVLTGITIKDATGNPLEITAVVVDVKTGSPWVLPFELGIQLVPLLGDFPRYDGKDWSAEEFQAAIVKPRHGNSVPLLNVGKVTTTDSRVTFEKLEFTDDSSWVSCRKFRIGACVVPVEPSVRCDGSFRIVEAMTEPFVVEDNLKHCPPVFDDRVWRLEMIDRNGEVHRKLMSNNVDTVQELYRMLTIQPELLRAILGEEIWPTVISHVTTCVPGDKIKMYRYVGASATIYLDAIFSRVLKMEVNGVNCSVELLHKPVQKMLVQQLISDAYENRRNLEEVEAAAVPDGDYIFNIGPPTRKPARRARFYIENYK